MRKDAARMFAVLLAAVVALVLGYATRAYAAPGDLDPSFDGDGKASTSFTGVGNEENGRDLAIQEDGKIVVVGHAYGGDATGFDFALTRYKPDGSLDPTFDVDGLVTTDFGGGPPICAGRPATIIGTQAADTLTGTPQNDVIVGLEGKDSIRAGGGSDIVCAGSGNDNVAGGKGKDRLRGERGNDRLRGGSGADRLIGGVGRDRLMGGSGDDFLLGGPGKDSQQP
jgi:Ca2+-binding RTX toxin-like protein